MKFIDYAMIKVKSGDGGKGGCSFRREKYVPKGGPDGGNGGRGGHVIFEGSCHLKTLIDFRFKREYFAQRGAAGGRQKRYGKDGRDLLLKVPLGTVIKDSSTQRCLANIVQESQQIIIARGGNGGKGNFCFRSSRSQTPYQYQEGKEGKEFSLLLELKSLADVGLIGCPNSGKSTLISQLSSKQSKVGDYAFTTLNPVLGLMKSFDHQTCVIADLPGLVKGAHKGVGLGLQFLKHIERCQFLIFLIDISFQNKDPWGDYQMLCEEIFCYRADLKNYLRFCVLNKKDLPYDSQLVSLFRERLKENVFLISAFTGKGCESLKKFIFQSLLRPLESF